MRSLSRLARGPQNRERVTALRSHGPAWCLVGGALWGWQQRSSGRAPDAVTRAVEALPKQRRADPLGLWRPLSSMPRLRSGPVTRHGDHPTPLSADFQQPCMVLSAGPILAEREPIGKFTQSHFGVLCMSLHVCQSFDIQHVGMCQIPSIASGPRSPTRQSPRPQPPLHLPDLVQGTNANFSCEP